MTVHDSLATVNDSLVTVVVYCLCCVLQTCTVMNASRMLCTSPSLRQSSINSTYLSSISPGAVPLCYGFVLDAVMSVRNLSHPATMTAMFLVHSDPLFHRFNDGFKTFFFLPNEYLTINVSSSAVCLCAWVVRSNTVDLVSIRVVVCLMRSYQQIIEPEYNLELSGPVHEEARPGCLKIFRRLDLCYVARPHTELSRV